MQEIYVLRIKRKIPARLLSNSVETFLYSLNSEKVLTFDFHAEAKPGETALEYLLSG
jgi:hypothetical protein